MSYATATDGVRLHYEAIGRNAARYAKGEAARPVPGLVLRTF